MFLMKTVCRRAKEKTMLRLRKQRGMMLADRRRKRNKCKGRALDADNKQMLGNIIPQTIKPFFL